MRVLLLLFLLPVVIVGCFMVTMSIPLPAGCPEAWSRGRSGVAAVVTGVVAMASFVGFVAYVVRRILRAGRVLDGAFKAAGLGVTGREGVGRRYGGAVRDRATTAGVWPSYRFEPWRVEVSMDAAPRVRLAMGSHRPLLDCREAPRLACDSPALANCHIHSADADAAGRLLADRAFLDALEPLLADWARASSWELYLQPERIWLRVRTRHVEEAMIGRWLDGLHGLAEACEAAGN